MGMYMPQYLCEGQRTHFGTRFFTVIMWVPGMELVIRHSGKQPFISMAQEILLKQLFGVHINIQFIKDETAVQETPKTM